MTFTKVTVWRVNCDFPLPAECPVTFEHVAEDTILGMWEARAAAEAAGWIRNREKDYCPKH